MSQDGRRLSTSSNRPLQENSNSGDISGRSSPYTESIAAEEVERTMAKLELERLFDGLGGIIVYCGLMLVVIAFSVHSMPDVVNPHATHASIPLDSPVAEPPPFSQPTYSIRLIHWLGRHLPLAAVPISFLLVGLSLRRLDDRPTQHDAWYQVTLCLYFAVLVKLLFDVDFGLFVTAVWWVGFVSVTLHHLARSCAVAQTMREHRRSLY